MYDGNSFGSLFRVTTFGESHGVAVGCVVDGCPAGLPLDESEIQAELDRRAPGGPQGSKRKEPDRVELLSGVFEGATLGTPVAMLVRNRDARSEDYEELARLYRPSHGDFSYDARYGRRDPRGGGRASARETVARVAAGAVAGALCRKLAGVEVVGAVTRVAGVVADLDPATLERSAVDAHEVRCPDPEAAARMRESIAAARKQGDTLGGVVSVVARDVPAGLGSPVFNKLDAALAAAMMSIPAVRGVEIGSGFAAATMRGSEHNDPFVRDGSGAIRTTTNNSGGIQAGLSNGMPIVCRVAFKPVPTHGLPQSTVTVEGEPATFTAGGRHDTCVAPRAVPIVEAMMRLVLADALLGLRLARVAP